VSARAERLVARLADAEADVLLVSDLVNVRYLTGYTGSSGLALVGPHTRTFITDFRYVEQAAEEVDPSFDRRTASQDLLELVGEALPSGPVRLGFDDAHVSVRAHARLRELLDDRVELVPLGGRVEQQRLVKDREEIDRIAGACALADEALEQVLSEGLAGRSEREVAVSLELAMRERGARSPSFDSIVAAGPHGALPHAQPRDVVITPGQVVVIDWGAELDGYCSDCTRTVATGTVDDHTREIYELVRAAQLAGLEAVRAGQGGREVDAIARAMIEDAGHGEHFGHGLGHGVGLEVHEAPRLSKRSEDELQADSTVTVEPGVYLPGEFGVRIEDLVAVTEAGCEILTGMSKDLRVVR
jgi:Xaa-Pro aminopeptidase